MNDDLPVNLPAKPWRVTVQKRVQFSDKPETKARFFDRFHEAREFYLRWFNELVGDLSLMGWRLCLNPSALLPFEGGMLKAESNWDAWIPLSTCEEMLA